MNAGDGHSGQRVTLTILFLDIVDSTKLFSAYDDEEVNGLLKSFLKDASQIIEAFEGLVNQVMGDGLMAVFGLTGQYEKHALTACQAAEELHRIFLNVGLRIGLHTGDVILEKNDVSRDPVYRIVGEPVHVAAKLEKVAAAGTTLISKDTYSLISDQVTAKFNGRHKIGNRPDPVQSFKFLSVNKRTLTGKRTKFFRASPFGGRQDELEVLVQGLQKSCDGARQAFLITGVAGFGKSRLIYEFLERGRALHPDLFVAEFSFLPSGASQSEFLKTLHDDCERALPPDTPSPMQPHDAWKGLDSSTLRSVMVAAVWDRLEAIALTRPVAIVIEDAHWADSDFQLFLQDFIGRSRNTRLALVLSSRPGGSVPQLDRIEPLTRIDLRPLDAAAQNNLLDEWLGSSITLSSLKKTILQAGEGNPLFLHETVSALLNSATLLGTNGHFICTHQGQDISLPTSLKALLDLRLRSLGERALFCLQCASVIGLRFNSDLLLQITDADKDELEALLQSLRNEGLVTALDDLANEHQFSHALLHEAAYASLLKQDSRRLHAKIFNILRHHPTRAKRLAPCAYHAHRAGLSHAGFVYNFLAGGRAVDQADGARAVAYFQHAIACLSQLSDRETDRRRYLAKCNLGLAFALSIQGDHPQARRVIAETREALPRLNGNYLSLRTKLNSLELFDYWVQGDLEAGAATGAALLEKCSLDSDPYAYVSTAIRVAGMLQDQGRYEESNAVLMPLSSFFGLHNASERYGNLFPPATTCPAMLSRNFGELGDFAAAELWAGRCQAIAKHSCNMLSIIYGLSYSATWLIRAHRFEDALPPLEAAYHQSGQIKTNLLYPFVASHYGFALFNTGETEAGLKIMEEAYDIARRQTANGRRSLYTQILAEAQFLQRDYQAAKNLAMEAIEIGQKFDEHANVARSYYLLAGCSLSGPESGANGSKYLKIANTMASQMKLQPLAADCDELKFQNAA